MLIQCTYSYSVSSNDSSNSDSTIRSGLRHIGQCSGNRYQAYGIRYIGTQGQLGLWVNGLRTQDTQDMQAYGLQDYEANGFRSIRTMEHQEYWTIWVTNHRVNGYMDIVAVYIMGLYIGGVIMQGYIYG